MLFKYQVLDKNKQIFHGEIEASDVKKARLSLMHQGYDVLMIDAATEKQRFLKKSFSSLGIVSLKDKMLFVKHLSLMIKSGLVLDEALEVLYEQSRQRMKVILYRLLTVVRKGSLLSDGLKLFPYTFSEFFINMVRIGENSGNLETNLINLSVKLKKDSDLRSKIRGAMLYPTIVLTALLGLGLTLSVIVLPRLAGFFKTLDVDVPLATQIFIIFADFIGAYWAFVVSGLILFIFIVWMINKVEKTKRLTHWVVFHAPLTRRFSKVANLANFCRSMNLLLGGGITIDESLSIMTRAVNNVMYRSALEDIMKQVKRGDPLAASLARHPHHFPTIVSKMIHVGEISGNLSETFEYLAEFYEDELENLSRNLSTVLEPFLLVIIGLLVGFVALAIISPIYQLTGGIA